MQLQRLLSDVEAGKYFIDTFEKIHGEDLEIGDMVKIMNGSYCGQIAFLDIVREGKKRHNGGRLISLGSCMYKQRVLAAEAGDIVVLSEGLRSLVTSLPLVPTT